MSKFSDVPISDDLTCCRCCHRAFARGDCIQQVMVVAGVDAGGRPGERLFLMEACEFAHFDCGDHRIVLARPDAKEVPRQILSHEKNLQPLRPRFNEYTCTACRQPVRRGDRIVVVTIVEGIAVDPATGFPAPQCTAEFEVAHCRCNDPALDRGEGPLLVIG